MKKQTTTPVNKRQLVRKLDHVHTPARYDGVTRNPQMIANVKKHKKQS